MPSYKLPLFKNVALNVIEKQKHLFWCRKNNFSYINRVMVYGLGEKFNNAETIQFSKTENAGYHKRN
jgi:ferrous iron transport protein B